MGDYMNFKYTLKDVSKFCRSNKLFYTPFYKFKNPNSHRVQGGLRLGSGQITGALILFPDLADKHLVWPAQLQFKFLACKKGKTKLLGTEEMKWELKDVKKFSEEIQWQYRINCSLEDLGKKKLIGQDDSLTFIWSVKLYFPQPQGFNLATSSRATSSHETTKGEIKSEAKESFVKYQVHKLKQEADSVTGFLNVSGGSLPTECDEDLVLDKKAKEIIRLLKIDIMNKVVKSENAVEKDGVIHADVDDTTEESDAEGYYDESQSSGYHTDLDLDTGMEEFLEENAKEIIRRLRIDIKNKVVKLENAEEEKVPYDDVEDTSENDVKGQDESQKDRYNTDSDLNIQESLERNAKEIITQLRIDIKNKVVKLENAEEEKDPHADVDYTSENDAEGQGYNTDSALDIKESLERNAKEIIRQLRIDIANKVVKLENAEEEKDPHTDVDKTSENDAEGQGYNTVLDHDMKEFLEVKAKEVIRLLRIDMANKVVKEKKKKVPHADVDVTSDSDAEGQGELQRGAGGHPELSDNIDSDTSYPLEIFSRKPIPGASSGLTATAVESINIVSSSRKKEPPPDDWFKKKWISALAEGPDVKNKWPTISADSTDSETIAKTKAKVPTKHLIFRQSIQFGNYWFKRKWISALAEGPDVKNKWPTKPADHAAFQITAKTKGRAQNIPRRKQRVRKKS